MSSAIPFLRSLDSGTKRFTFLRSSLLRNLGITFLENVMSKGLNFLIILVMTRSLGPEDYGKYSFIFVTVTLCSALFDFGMENTAVRFAARDQEKKQTIFGLYFLTKLLILLGLTAFFIFAGEQAFATMHKESVAQYMPYLIIGLLGESLFFVNDTWLQANQRFQFRAILNVARYSVALLYIIGLACFHKMLLQAAMIIYLIPLAFSCFFLPNYVSFVRSFFRNRLDKSLLGEITDYEKWMFVYAIANNMLGRVDFFMLGFWVGFHQLGIYNAAFQLCSIVSFLPFVLGKVLLPTLSSQTEEEVFKTTNSVLRVTCLFSLAVIALTPLSQWVIPLLLGKEYAASITILQILLITFSGGLISMPYEQALYALGRPKVMTLGKYLQLGIIVLLNIATIPIFGIYAAATNVLVGRVLYLIFINRYYKRCMAGLISEPELDEKLVPAEVTA